MLRSWHTAAFGWPPWPKPWHMWSRADALKRMKCSWEGCAYRRIRSCATVDYLWCTHHTVNTCNQALALSSLQTLKRLSMSAGLQWTKQYEACGSWIQKVCILEMPICQAFLAYLRCKYCLSRQQRGEEEEWSSSRCRGLSSLIDRPQAKKPRGFSCRNFHTNQKQLSHHWVGSCFNI